MPAPSDRRSPLALIVLALLAEQPMHPYRMFQLLTQRGKTAIVNVTQRNSLYQVIDRLMRAGLVQVHGTEKSENRPERTIYAITPAGRETVVEWIREILSTDKPEYPSFPAALSLLALLPPTEAHEALTTRRDLLTAKRATSAEETEAALQMGLPHLFLLDDEYKLVMLDAELAWLDGLIAEFDSGSLDWSEEWIAGIAAQFNPSD